MGIIYKAVNLKNGKMYIGKTVGTLQGRRRSHHGSLKYLNTYFSKAIKKYGKKSFLWEIIEECNDEVLYEKEKFYIQTLNTKAPFGYNLTDGGDGAATGELNVSKRKEVRLKLKEKSSNFKHTDETKRILSKKAKEQFKNGMPEETKLKIGKPCKGHNASKGSKNSMSKTYYFLNPNGEKIKVVGIRDFCRKNNLDHSCMVALSKFKLKQHKGYRSFQ